MTLFKKLNGYSYAKCKWMSNTPSDEENAQLKAENAKLWELVNMLRYCAHEAHGTCARWPVGGGKPFTCCPFYDFDSKEYRCKKLMRELGIKV